MSTESPRVCFVIPTYNEALNITPLLQRLSQLYGDPNTAFLIVDDNSPDGTAERVREFAGNERRVHLLQGQRRGLGQAYVRGITHAMDALGAHIVVQMDADFSHDPADVRKLLQHLADGADVAIGSRYVSGGALDEKWSAWRRLLSRWGNRLARWIAGLGAVRDCTSGFKAIRVEALRDAEIENIRVQGYAFQVALLHRLLHTNARIIEQPIYFREREVGQTKLGLRDLVEFFYNVWWLRLMSYRTFMKFAVTGLIGAVVNLGLFQIMLEFGVHELIASPIAIEVSIISNFLINNHWTFTDRAMVGRRYIRGLKFNLVSLGTLTLSYATFVLLLVLFPNVPPVWLQACGILPSALLNYFLNSYWTFRDAGTETRREG